MGVMFCKQRGMIRVTKIGKLASTSLIVHFSAALVGTIWALYINSFLHNPSGVGFVTAFLTLTSFLAYFFLIPLVEKKNKSKLLSLSLALFIIFYVLLGINKSFYFFLFLAVCLSIIISLRITTLGIIIRDESSTKQVSRNEGIIYTFLNLSWVIGPLVAGYVANRFGIGNVFFLAALFSLFALIIFKISKINDPNIKKKADTNPIKNFFAFFKSRERVIAYFLGGGVNLWFSLTYIFIPLLIIKSHLNDLWVGYFLFALIIPLLILEYPFSKLAGKIGFKKIFKIGFFILTLMTILCFFTSNIFIIMGLLVLAGVGMAMVEPTTEAYFFDILNEKDELRFYGPYNTAIDVNHFVAQASAATLLIFLPFKFLFLLFGLFMFILFLLAFKTKAIIEKNRR